MEGGRWGGGGGGAVRWPTRAKAPRREAVRGWEGHSFDPVIAELRRSCLPRLNKQQAHCLAGGLGGRSTEGEAWLCVLVGVSCPVAGKP